MPYTNKGKMQSLLDNLKTPDNIVVLVDSATGNDSNSGVDSWSNALATLDAAIAKCTANNGDKILVAPGHSETYTTTGTKVTFDVAGVEVYGLGEGASKPTFTFGHTGATMLMSAASNKLKNVKFVTNVDLVTTYLTISGADCEIDIETRDATDKEVITDVTITGARPKVNIKKLGYVDGDANARVVSLNAAHNADINVYAMTKVTTAIVNFVTAPSLNVDVKGMFYVKSTTDFTKNVVDTITGSVFSVQGFDMGAGQAFSGNSSTPAADDVGAIYARLGVPAGASVSADIAAMKAVVDAIAGYVDTEVAAIKNKTDNLPVSPAATADIANALVDIKNKDIGATFSAATDSLEAVSEVINAANTLLGTIADVAGTDTIVALLKAIKAKTDTIT